MEHIVKILSIEPLTHNVKQIRLEKPGAYDFTPGQATEVSINKPGWVEEKRPFTFTSLPDDSYLEFTIKSYRDHNGVTNEIDHLKPGDELVIRDVWGAISYQGEGYFIAGGAGITPFIAILRQLNKQHSIKGNQLIFSNRTPADILLKEELQTMLGNDVLFVVTGENTSGFERQRIDKAFLQKHIRDFSKHFYICGPDKMVSDLNQVLLELGAQPKAVVFEK